MRIQIPRTRLEYFLTEDVPYIDLTSIALGIGDQPGSMEYFTREDCILCGTEEVVRLANELGIRVLESRPSGSMVSAGESFLWLEGPADALHQLWKVGLNIFDHLSAVSTCTHKMVSAVHDVNPHCEVLTTRKSMPGVKDLLTHAVMVGGAFPHRLGLSETVLVFDHHISFLGGFESFIEKIPEIRSKCSEKKLFVEATPAQARMLAQAGVDGIQLDKTPVDDLAALVNELRSIAPHITLIAAGGVNASNAAAYAGTGVDGLATTSPFNAKPLDMSVRMGPAE